MPRILALVCFVAATTAHAQILLKNGGSDLGPVTQANADTTTGINFARSGSLGTVTCIMATGSVAGCLSTTTQTIAGAKTFTGAISASNLSGTNTGDVTIGTFGTSPTANAASLSGQVLTIQPADGTHPGAVTTGTQTFAGAKTFTSLDVTNYVLAPDHYATTYWDRTGGPAYLVGTGTDPITAVRVGANENLTNITSCLLDVGKNYQSGGGWTSEACFRPSGVLELVGGLKAGLVGVATDGGITDWSSIGVTAKKLNIGAGGITSDAGVHAANVVGDAVNSGDQTKVCGAGEFLYALVPGTASRCAGLDFIGAFGQTTVNIANTSSGACASDFTVSMTSATPLTASSSCHASPADLSATGGAAGLQLTAWASSSTDCTVRPCCNGSSSCDPASQLYTCICSTLNPAIPRVLAYFEFAPPESFGLGTVCNGSAPTGANGEIIVFGRASSRSCMKSHEFSSIANGDLVTLTTGQPAVMPGGDGSGGLGLSVWDTRTTRAVYSDNFSNVSWVLQGIGVSAPTFTNNFAVAPDGTTTAARLQVVATSTGEDAVIYQGAPSGSATVVSGFFVKGNAGSSGTVDVCGYGAGGWNCADCVFNGTTWTRCSVPAYTSTNPDYILVGNATNYSTVARASSADILIWGAQTETTASPSPYIPSGVSGATRAAEVAYTTLSVSGNTRSFADTWVAPDTLVNGATPLDLYTDGTNDLRMEVQSNKLRCSFTIGGSTTTLDSSGTLTASSPNRVACYYDGTDMGVCLEGSCNTATHALTLPTTATVYFGARQDGTNYANGVHKKVCIDNASASKCR